jgi:flavin reductase (DIM6/NTAB) family NADH-FMN oxidoreductase RutF
MTPQLSTIQTPSLADELKRSMRRLPSGVSILTTRTSEARYGMTMTAAMSLSVAPPSVVIGVNRGASIWSPLLDRGLFCLNLLKAEHLDMCSEFSARQGEDRFAVGAWRDNADGIPYLADAQARIFCRCGPSMDYGTHCLIVGEVTDISIDDTINPLAFLDGRFIVPIGEVATGFAVP